MKRHSLVYLRSLFYPRSVPFFLLAALLAGCSGGGGGGSNEPQVTLQGTVVDGYVNGATVTLYSTEDLAGPSAIASGVTDVNGDYLIRLPESDLPDYFALLSKGGTVIDTGLPAPTMALVALREQDRYNVTPLTDRIVRQGLRPDSSFIEAEEALAAELGLTGAELYGDPLAADAPPALRDGLDRALAAGELSVRIPDGDYRLALVAIDKNAIHTPIDSIDTLLANHYLSGSITIAGGEVSGTLEGEAIEGRVQGANVVMSVNYPGGVTRVAGTLGLLGSLSGTYVDFDDTPQLSTGVFVGSLMPAEGVDADGLEQTAEALYRGNRNALFRDLYGDRDLAWGAMGNVTLDTVNDTVSVDSFDIELNAAAGETGHMADSITFNEGRLLTFADGTPNGLAVMRFTDSSEDYAYLVQALGNRRGVYVACDTNNSEGYGNNAAYAIGESYLARRDALGADAFGDAQGQDLQLAVSTISPQMLGAPRDPTGFVETGTLTVPTLTDGAGAVGDASTVSGVQALSGSLLGVKVSAAGVDTAIIDHEDDYLAVGELHATGALQGDVAVGGTLTIGGTEIVGDTADWPVPVVAFATPSGTTTALMTLGEMQADFLARPLYTLDLEISDLVTLEDYRLGFISGTITADGETATLRYRDSAGETGTLGLTIQNRSGIYHLHGPMGEEYIDILWPAGGTRAVFLSSTRADGFGDVYEIGEAFLTY